MRSTDSSRPSIYGALAVAIILVAGLASTASAQQWTNNGNDINNTNSGNVGVGTTTPQTKVDVGGWTGRPTDIVGALANFGGPGGGDAFYGNTGASTGRIRLASNANQGFLQWNVYFNGAGLRLMDPAKAGFEVDLNGFFDQMIFKRYTPGSGVLGPPQSIMVLTANGRVGIGTTAPAFTLDVAGSIRASSIIGATYQDLAEWVPAKSKMAPGTVVVLNPDVVNEVMPSTQAYDVTVAGVVSANPGIILGEEGASKERIATTGRVKVKVDATRLPIRVGDLLVTGERAGTAVRSEPINVQGRKFHQPGTIIGKALEPLPKGEGEILVLLSLQ